jgi:4-hydroxythreonine-4-phosphate dehydrogenase
VCEHHHGTLATGEVREQFGVTRKRVPGDTVFVKLRAGQYDAVVAMYHDQGHIPVKLLGFQVDPATGRWDALSGVNITLGLPIIRTSVDHGTAFDIAGRGIASEQSLVEAIEYAEALSRKP